MNRYSDYSGLYDDGYDDFRKKVKTLHHRNDPKTSREAADRMVKSGALNRQEQEVYNDIRRYIIDCKHNDFTPKELGAWCGTDYHTIQRRLSGLRDKGKIERIYLGVDKKSGRYIFDRRDGCCVWRLKGEL